MLFFQQAFDRTIDTGWLMGVPGIPKTMASKESNEILTLGIKRRLNA
ncbi:MAG: hypothetical protein ABFS24_14985 [Pseudomonadota bacterium]